VELKIRVVHCCVLHKQVCFCCFFLYKGCYKLTVQYDLPGKRYVWERVPGQSQELNNTAHEGKYWIFQLKINTTLITTCLIKPVHTINQGLSIKVLLKLHASRWTNITRTSNLRKNYWDFNKRKKIQDKSNNFNTMCNLWPIFSIFHYILLCYYFSKGYNSIFAYFDLFLVIKMSCKQCLFCENYFLYSLYNTSSFKTITKFSWKLAWIWRHSALYMSYNWHQVLKMMKILEPPEYSFTISCIYNIQMLVNRPCKDVYVLLYNVCNGPSKCLQLSIG
jgi:hypothetical protein